MSVQQFKPAWWLRNSHLQTMWPALCRKRKKLALQRERLELPDGDFLDIDWIGKEAQGPLVIMMHGFEGSIDSHYATGMLGALAQQSMRCVFMHFRGCSGEPNRLLRSYHSGDTQDVAYLVQTIQQREPDTALAAIGFSLGGNVLLKWLGETGSRNPLQAAAAISVPFVLKRGAERFQKGFSRLYQWYFLKCLRTRLAYKFKFVQPKIEPALIFSAKSIRDFDSKYTAPLHGFANVDEYYTTASSRQYLRHITVPTLIVHAKDDPFMYEDMIPHRSELSPHVALEVSDTGGHVGFVAGTLPWRAEYWLEKRIPAFLSKYIFNKN
jgi:predicted alpha/beta-fold hydrolase